MFKSFLAAVFSILPMAGFAQEFGEESWTRFTEIEIDVSVENLLEPLTAVIIYCGLESDTLNKTVGQGYTVLYQGNPEDEGLFERVYDDRWLDRTTFTPVDGLQEGGLSETVNVSIYGNKTYLASWTNGVCFLGLSQIPPIEMDVEDWTESPVNPQRCSPPDPEIYANIWACVASDEDWYKTFFTFRREESEAITAAAESQ